jgi:LysR family transcriptional regulator, glycine cleavage system transcriptional activator
MNKFHRASELGYSRMKLPSISEMLAFDAVARHLSFTRAGVELNLTQTAISHQIKRLEEALGAPLFVRQPHGLALTHIAHDYLASVRESIATLRLATDRVLRTHASGMVTVACLGTFALKCLIPKLQGFKREHPDIAVNVRTFQPHDTRPTVDFDVAIHYGAGDWPGLDAEKIGEEEVFPVCSGVWLDRIQDRAPKSLRNCTVIRTSSPLILRDDWTAWLREAGVPDLTFSDEAHFDLLHPSLQAAVDGLGIAMGRSAVVKADIAAGRLFEPFNIKLSSTSNYYLLSHRDRLNRPEVSAFREWLFATVPAWFDRLE